MDLGAGPCDGIEPEVFVAACAKLNLDRDALSTFEKEAREVLARVNEALKYKSAATMSNGEPASAQPTPATKTAPPASARRPNQSLLARMWRVVVRRFH
jgi:hypothetical protein